MGLLDYIIQSGQATKRNIRSLLDDPSGYTNALLNRGVENTQAHLNKLTGKPYDQNNEQAYQDAMNEAALAAMTVYHGSPHKFDKFDMDKIGTGEGAQAYGHGLYMAESPAVARDYAEKLAQNAKLQTADGRVVNFGPPPKRTLSYALKNRGTSQYEIEPWQKHLAMNEGNMRKATTAAKKQLKEMQDSAAKMQAIGINDSHTAFQIKHWQDVLDGLKTKGKGSTYDPGSYMYKVDIPDEAIPRMLDWDKPLSQQSEYVRGAIDKLPNRFRPQDTEEWNNVLGERLYRRMENAQGVFGYESYPEVSKSLKKLGIPGIRYLDGGSRGAGTGTYNYVLFDDQLPRILERNGVPMGNKPWAPGEYTGLLGR